MMNYLLAAVSLPLLTALLSADLLEAQSPTPVAFEVASLRPHPHSLPGGGMAPKVWMPTFQCPPDYRCGLVGKRFREVDVSLADLIVDAYKVKKFQIAGLPDWGDSERARFDLDAKVADGATPAVADARLMLQSFLAERFHLKIRHENRLLPVYALVVAKKGLKLIPNQICRAVKGGSSVKARGGQLPPDADSPDKVAYSTPWAFYAEQLAIFSGRPIIDETGLDGTNYCTAEGQNPTLAIAMELYSGNVGTRGTAETPSTSPSIFTVVEDTWGIKLEPRKAEVDVIVIEKVERPSEN